jgi:plasmid stabilization system protein ParE
MPVRWSTDAEFDVTDILTYLLEESPTAARATAARLWKGTAALHDFPRRGRIVPELQRLGIEEWRELVIAPYRVIYTIEPDGVEIDAVIDSRRDIEMVLLRRFVRVGEP